MNYTGNIGVVERVWVWVGAMTFWIVKVDEF